MPRPHRIDSRSLRNKADPASAMLPSLATAEQIAAALQVTARTVHLWASANPPVIPVAFRQGRIVRFHPPDVARALGIALPEFGLAAPGKIRVGES